MGTQKAKKIKQQSAPAAADQHVSPPAVTPTAGVERILLYVYDIVAAGSNGAFSERQEVRNAKQTGDR